MRKCLLILFLFFPFIVVVSQNINLTGFNTVFVGLQNPMEIQTNQESKIIPKISNEDMGLITEKNGKYYIIPSKEGEITINLFKEVNKDSIILIDSCKFISKPFPEPIAYLNSTFKQKITVKQLLSCDNLLLKTPIDFETNFKIIGFTFNPIINGYETSVISNSDSITKRQKELMRKCVPKSKVYFTNIKVKYLNSEKIIKAKPFYFEITGNTGFVSYVRKYDGKITTVSDGGFIAFYYLKNIDSLIVKDNTTEKLCPVSSFSLSVNNKTFNSNSNKLTEGMLNEIKKLKKNKCNDTKVFFYDIKFLDEDNTEYYALPIGLNVIYGKRDMDEEGRRIRKN